VERSGTRGDRSITSEPVGPNPAKTIPPRRGGGILPKKAQKSHKKYIVPFRPCEPYRAVTEPGRASGRSWSSAPRNALVDVGVLSHRGSIGRGRLLRRIAPREDPRAECHTLHHVEGGLDRIGDGRGGGRAGRLAVVGGQNVPFCTTLRRGLDRVRPSPAARRKGRWCHILSQFLPLSVLRRRGSAGASPSLGFRFSG
jgi:hypothetical protein